MKQTLTIFASLLLALAIPQSVKAYDFEYTYQGKTLYYNIVDGNAQVTRQIESYPNYNTYSTGDIVIPSSVTNGDSTYNVTSIGSYAFSNVRQYEYYDSLIATMPFAQTKMSANVCGLVKEATTQVVKIPSVDYKASIFASAPAGTKSFGTEVGDTLTEGFWDFTDTVGMVFGDRGKVAGRAPYVMMMNPDSNYRWVRVDMHPQSLSAYSNYFQFIADSNDLRSHADDYTSSRGWSIDGLIRSILDRMNTSYMMIYPIATTVNPLKRHNAYVQFPAIDNPEVGNMYEIRFNQNYRKYYDRTYIDFKVGTEWYAREINIDGIDADINAWADGYKAYVMPVEFGQQEQLEIRFRLYNPPTDGNNGIRGDSYGYLWAFDDVAIVKVASGSPLGYTEGDFVYSDSTKTNLLAYIGTGGNVTIPNSVTSIATMAFSGCIGLTSVTIPNSVTSIGDYAFSGCIGLTSVTISNSVTSIGNYAFKDCSGLTSVNIPNSVTSIGGGAFSDCSGLTSATIPNSVTSIGGSAFYGCSSLTSITIPNLVTAIRSYAFYNCSSLTSVTIPNSVTSIRGEAFENCSGLTSINIPNSVTSIGFRAFYNCISLTSVTIPNSVTSIDNYAFAYCSGLTEITSLAPTAPTLGSSTFSGVSSTIPVYIPCGNLASYQTTWSYFSNISEIAPYSISVGVTNSTFGVSNVTEGPTCDSMAVIEAVANYGYHFTQWNDGNTDNPRTITLTQDTHIVAIFAKNIYTLDFQSDNSSIGVVDTTSISGEYLDTSILVHATAIPHHHFVRWNDNNTENPRHFVFDDNHTYTAYFAIDTHTVSVQSNDIARGMVEATGTEFVYGTPCTVTATAYSGYTFAGWSNGMTANPYTFAVMSDVELTALFISEDEQIYTITVESADLTMGTVSGGGQALYGGEVSIRATANDGYRFVRWNDNDTHAVRTVTVTANATYTAYFESTTQGITDVVENNITVYVENGEVKVLGNKEEPVRVFNMMGQQMNNNALPTGVYLVKVGNHPARKVVVIR